MFHAFFILKILTPPRPLIATFTVNILIMTGLLDYLHPKNKLNSETGLAIRLNNYTTKCR